MAGVVSNASISCFKGEGCSGLRASVPVVWGKVRGILGINSPPWLARPLGWAAPASAEL